MANQRELPFSLIGAGLPNLRAVLSTARSYAERLFTYATIGPLSLTDAADALAAPAQRLGADYTPEALTRLIEVSNGYPYFLQTFGAAIWDLAPDAQFTLADADLAITDGWDQLDAGFLPCRWERATPPNGPTCTPWPHSPPRPAHGSQVQTPRPSRPPTS